MLCVGCLEVFEPPRLADATLKSAPLRHSIWGLLSELSSRAPTPATSPAGRHGDWRCRCRSSARWSSWPPPAASLACSSGKHRKQTTNKKTGEQKESQHHIAIQSPLSQLQGLRLEIIIKVTLQWSFIRDRHQGVSAAFSTCIVLNCTQVHTHLVPQVYIRRGFKRKMKNQPILKALRNAVAHSYHIWKAPGTAVFIFPVMVLVGL